MKDITVQISKLSSLISDRFLRKLLKRWIAQQNATTAVDLTPNKDTYDVRCYNGTNVSWDEVLNTFISFKNSGQNLDIYEGSFSKALEVLSSNILTTTAELNLSEQGIEQILKLCPIVLLKTKKGSYFLNLHKFVYTPGALEIFLNAEEDKLIEDKHIEDTEPTIMQPKEKSKSNSASSENSKRGQPSLVKLFPTIRDSMPMQKWDWILLWSFHKTNSQSSFRKCA